jgi:UDP-GlcNAc:undecaprenyl-phosphate GlcNAc-1-phosphate transferase
VGSILVSIAGFLTAAGTALVLTPLLARIAPLAGLLDHPGAARKVHAQPVPLVGGIAMGVAILAAYYSTSLGQGLDTNLGVALAIALIGGVLDDCREQGSGIKFAFQIVAAAVIATTTDALLVHLGHLMSPELFTLGRWSTALTIFAIVGVMNALNMIDGLDGLAGGLALSALLLFALAAALAGNAFLFALISICVGALIGFLAWNAPLPGRAQARVFMGDTGSMLLGLVLAWFAIRLAMAPNSTLDPRAAISPITAVWILGVPIADTVTIMTRRVLRGASPFVGDREHVHHILLAAGQSARRVVAVLFLLAFLLGAAGLAAVRAGVPDYVMFYAYVAGLIAWGSAAEIACRKLKLRTPRRQVAG